MDACGLKRLASVVEKRNGSLQANIPAFLGATAREGLHARLQRSVVTVVSPARDTSRCGGPGVVAILLCGDGDRLLELLVRDGDWSVQAFSCYRSDHVSTSGVHRDKPLPWTWALGTSV